MFQILLKAGHYRPASEYHLNGVSTGGQMMAKHGMLAWHFVISGDRDQYC